MTVGKGVKVDVNVGNTTVGKGDAVSLGVGVSVSCTLGLATGVTLARVA